jgi:DNA mismatch repair protein MutS
MQELTPLMEQYFELLNSLTEEYILLFQVGDFYEMFDKQAQKISEMIGLALTEKNKFAMCGIPVGNLSFYLRKLVKEYHCKVAVCEQVETPEEAKKRGSSLVKRSIVKRITPGTYSDFIEYQNNFVLCITKLHENIFEFCYGDVSTGECFTSEIHEYLLHSEITKINPNEILCNESLLGFLSKFDDLISVIHDDRRSFHILKSYFETCGYKFDVLVNKVDNSCYMQYSSSTIGNLEIFADSRGNQMNSLANALNKCKTPMGKRLFMKVFSRPLSNMQLIKDRHDCVEFFMKRFYEEGLLRLDIGDMDKILNIILERFKTDNRLKLIYDLALNIQKSLDFVQKIAQNMPVLLKMMHIRLGIINCHVQILKSISISEDNLIINSDIMNTLICDRKKILEQIQSCETYGINCRIKYVNDQYFLEVSRGTKVPNTFIFQRSLLAADRYTTSELIKLENDLSVVNEKIQECELNTIHELSKLISVEKEHISKLAECISYIDLFQTFAMAGLSRNYVRPSLVENQCLNVKNGRHPFIEMKKIVFVHNDTDLNDKVPIYIITGPNMGGKSTYLRQNALIIWMCQIGMFVPAESVRMCVFKQMAVRIGAGDNISEDQSTFMLEMSECAEICNLATNKSIFFLDELGRGTSPHEGTAILCAVIKYIQEKNGLAMFATHYSVTNKFPLEYQKRVSVKLSPEITLLYRIEDGEFNTSFARYVIEKSVMPKSVLEYYDQFLKNK